MENLFSTLFTSTGNTTNTTNASNAIMGCPQNSQFSSMYGPLSYHSTPSNSITQSSCVPPQYFMPAPCESWQNPYMHSLEKPSHHTPSTDPFLLAMAGQNAFEMQRSCILQPNALQLEQERRALDAYKTKLARCKRKLARQSKTSSTQIMDARRLALHGASTSGQRSRSNTSEDLYEFLTPDNKRLRAVLRKDLKNSDVGSLGRIVLPKREVEENLPVLNDKEGILLFLRDVYSNQEWALKFKFWSNNKSRMYILENTGEFVKRNGLETGDFLTLYEDESKNLYFSISRVGRSASVPSPTSQPINHNCNCLYTPHMCQARDEEQSSLALLIEQLDQKEQEEADSLVAVPPDSAYMDSVQLTNNPFNNSSTYSQPASSAMQPSSPNGKMKAVDDSHVDDCYTGLGVLPDVYRYNFSL
ncbi:PREDICTED: B3 domain-containing transcription factor LEC2 [Populus euphratica]|uniref:B3 domain-containing transcription factor LEC2 n=1 Tax=Populus euphratica TaxID=75702 RepID=A0AAJ6XR52_POPEU|nr:PREDICTED: B3 domain-containing transcription factor LEC2 [Populus euphratica]